MASSKLKTPTQGFGPAAPKVDEYAFWELSRMPEFEEAGRVAAEQALPLIRALIAAAAARRDWERLATGEG